LGLRYTHRLAPSPHQSEARLPADLLWVRSRHCAGPVVWGVSTSSHRRRWVGRPAAELLPPDPGTPSVVVWKEHRGERAFPLTPDVVGDDPERAVLGSAVAGEKPAVAAMGGLTVGGLVVLADLAPVARVMAIEQAGDLVMGHGGSHRGGGHHTAEVVAHGQVSGMGRESGARWGPAVVAAVSRDQAMRACPCPSP